MRLLAWTLGRRRSGHPGSAAGSSSPCGRRGGQRRGARRRAGKPAALRRCALSGMRARDALLESSRPSPVNGVDLVFRPGGEAWARAAGGAHVVLARAAHLTNLDHPAVRRCRQDVRRRGSTRSRRRGGATPAILRYPTPSRQVMRTKGRLPRCRMGPVPPRHEGAAQGDAAPGRQAVIQYAVEEAVAGGIEQVITVTSSQSGRSRTTRSRLRARAPAREGRDREAPPIRHISDLAQIAYVRQKEQLGLGPRGADGQGPHRPRAVRGHPPGRRRRRRAAVHRPADQRVPPGARVCRRGHGGRARGDAAVRRHRRPIA